MKEFEFKRLAIDGARLVVNRSAEDDRGSFLKDFEEKEFEGQGLRFHCTETFFSQSKKNVIRGLHFQIEGPQAKLVHVVSGRIYDVMVDLRKDSPSFGTYLGIELSAENHYGLYLPRGCAHGFFSLEEGSIVCYKCEGTYSQGSDSGIVYNDKELDISWPIENTSECIISERDRKLMTFREFRDRYQGF